MKKVVFLFLFALLTIGATVYADDISLIGKKVEGDTVITVGDRTIEAVIIDGKSFIPVRETADVLGYDIKQDDQGFILNKKDGITVQTSKKGIPYIEFNQGENQSQLMQIEDLFQIGTSGDAILYPENDLRLTPENDLRLSPYSGNIYVPNWSRIINNQTGESLQDVIDKISE